ncbi:hypothetical protein D0C36_23180 [Mucilaginibacter conchicola]|uniref:IPT/TIG domain-containing protein n=1 Tax=Mucilaginibacter conchicola TaxID=2303333 RepID=A0A372NMH2_9SPHI|nr:IPT/TIG domain-containing protein [Mucilaginibacter conchicola]RFZ90146.1 hypothetical protein D0C36_23180 [Mucilaginibacter conchicola]
MPFNKALIKLFFPIFLGLFVISCSKVTGPPAPVDPVKPQPGQQEVVITSLSVDHGSYNQSVVIKGSGFNKELSANKVSFNNKEAVITAASSTQLTVNIPLGAGTGKVIVTNGAKSATVPSFTYDYTFMTTVLAGNGIRGMQNGKGPATSFGNIVGLAVNSAGEVFVADQPNNLIRKISPDGEVSTFAGDGVRRIKDGKGITASFSYPSAIAIDKHDNLFVVDAAGNLIRKITPTGDVSTFAGSETEGYTNGNGSAAQFKDIDGIAVDISGNVFVVDQYRRIIRKITPAGDVSNYLNINAYVNYPALIATDNANKFYMCFVLNTDFGGDTIYQFNNQALEKTDSPGATFEDYMSGVAIDNKNNMYILNSKNQILKINTNGEKTILNALNNNSNNKTINALTPHITAAYSPSTIAVDNNGICYIPDDNGLRILKIGLQ